MNTMIIIGMGVKIASVCLVGMASSEGLNFFQTKKLRDLKAKNPKNKSKLSIDKLEKESKEDERYESLYSRRRDRDN